MQKILKKNNNFSVIQLFKKTLTNQLQPSGKGTFFFCCLYGSVFRCNLIFSMAEKITVVGNTAAINEKPFFQYSSQYSSVKR